MSAPAVQAEEAVALPLHYPTRLIDVWRLGSAQRLLLRPVLPQDDILFATMLREQPADALRWRFHGAVRPSALWCQRMSRVDYRRQLALVVCAFAEGVEQLVAEARYSVIDDGLSADCALMVDARWHCKGVGRWLLGALMRAAAGAGLERLECEVLCGNQAMLALARRCGFVHSATEQDGRLLRLRRWLAHAHARDGLISEAPSPSSHEGIDATMRPG